MGVESANRLIEAARRTPYHALFYTALYAGLRRSELLGLRWKDIDLDFATMSVVQALHQVPGAGYVFREPKTRRSKRLIDMPPSLTIQLREHRASEESTRRLLGRSLAPEDLVFCNVDGTPLQPNSVTKAFRMLARSVDLPGLRLHDLRHTHATIMLKQGVHPKVVQERLGHSSIAITLDTYSHVLPGLQASAALRFDEGLASVPTVDAAKASGR